MLYTLLGGTNGWVQNLKTMKLATNKSLKEKNSEKSTEDEYSLTVSERELSPIKEQTSRKASQKA
jgi:hypothetical protein